MKSYYYIIQHDYKTDQRTLWLATTNEDMLCAACHHLLDGANLDMLEDFSVIELTGEENDGHPVWPLYLYCARKDIKPKVERASDIAEYLSGKEHPAPMYGVECIRALSDKEALNSVYARMCTEQYYSDTDSIWNKV